MTTAGIAAASPKAVASSASAMPGATTARLVVCSFEMPMKLFMMPQTVPNRPTNGAVAPMVASTLVPRMMRRPQAASIRSSREATRSLMPSGSALSCDSRISATAGFEKFSRPGLRSRRAARRRSASRCADGERPQVGALTRRRAITSSTVLASHTVQVTTDAKASPISTAFTSGSALRNMPHGLRSRGSAALPTTGPAASGACAHATAAESSHTTAPPMGARTAASLVRRIAIRQANLLRTNIPLRPIKTSRARL